MIIVAEEAAPKPLNEPRADGARHLCSMGPQFPRAHGRVFRGDRQRAQHYVALLGLLSLPDILRLSNRDRVPDHAWLSKTRSRLALERTRKCSAGF